MTRFVAQKMLNISNWVPGPSALPRDATNGPSRLERIAAEMCNRETLERKKLEGVLLPDLLKPLIAVIQSYARRPAWEYTNEDTSPPHCSPRLWPNVSLTDFWQKREYVRVVWWNRPGNSVLPPSRRADDMPDPSQYGLWCYACWQTSDGHVANDYFVVPLLESEEPTFSSELLAHLSTTNP